MKRISSFAVVIISLVFTVVPGAASAQSFEVLYQQEKTLTEPKVYQIDTETLMEMLALHTECGKCDANISGKWRYTLLKKNIPYHSEDISINQFGNSFKAVSRDYTLVGSLRGQWLNLSLVVTGEETEGYVMKVDGSVDGNRITGVFRDSHGDVGSFVAVRR